MDLIYTDRFNIGGNWLFVIRFVYPGIDFSIDTYEIRVCHFSISSSMIVIATVILEPVSRTNALAIFLPRQQVVT